METASRRPEESPTEIPRPDIRPLTAIRGFAAWWVVFYHFKAYFHGAVPDALFRVVAHGELAVDLFFCLSGFVICLNYAGMSFSGGDLGRFYVKRFARLYPLHATLLLGYAIYAAGIVSLRGIYALGDRFGTGSFLLNAALAQDWGILGWLTWNIPAWSISAEFAAYLVFPILLRVLRVRTAGALRLAAAAVACYGLLLLVYARWSFDLGTGISQVGALRCILQFGMGMTASELYLRRRRQLAPFAPILLCVGLALLAITIVRQTPSAFLMPPAWLSTVLGLAALEGGPARLLSSRALVYLGEISYATYLSHYLVYDVFKALFVPVEGSAPGWALALSWAAILAASPFLYHLVERPAQRWVTALLLNGKGRPRARAVSA